MTLGHIPQLPATIGVLDEDKPDLLPAWLPPSWGSPLFPVVDTPDAIRHWLSWSIKNCPEITPEEWEERFAGGWHDGRELPYVRDAAGLVRRLQTAQRWRCPPARPKGKFVSGPDGFAATRTYLNAVLAWVEDCISARRREAVRCPARQATADNPSAEKPAIKVEEADAVARTLAKKDPAFVNGTAPQWAEKIAWKTGKSCSPSTVHATTLWEDTMKATGRGRTRGAQPRAMALTEAVEATHGMGQPHEILNQLAAEEAGAIEAIQRSGMKDTEKEATLRDLKAGTMTPAQASEIARLHPQKKKKTAKLFRVV